MGKGLRLQLLSWSLMIGVVVLLGGAATFAWYTLREREVETTTANVMKPYYLSLRNPNESDVLQLSVGSLLQGKTKQIVFCVSSEEEARVNQDTTIFDYALELVHTDNLALEYELYPLQKVDVEEGESREDLILTEHEIVTGEGTKETAVIYWQKTAGKLTGTDVSEERWAQAGLVEEDFDGDMNTATQGVVNRGTYISYAIHKNGEETIDNNLELTAGENSAQYFVLEISWAINSGFEKYHKETDMIYLVAKVLQPEPEEVQ